MPFFLPLLDERHVWGLVVDTNYYKSVLLRSAHSKHGYLCGGAACNTSCQKRGSSKNLNFLSCTTCTWYTRTCLRTWYCTVLFLRFRLCSLYTLNVLLWRWCVACCCCVGPKFHFSNSPLLLPPILVIKSK